MHRCNAERLAEFVARLEAGPDPAVDGAGWHVGSTRVVPENISLVVIPPCSPELNPVENVWQYLRANEPAIRVLDD